MFFKGSRYANTGELDMTGPDGRVIRYKAIRFIPDTKARVTHTVRQGERPDHISHQYFRNPERFWRICDANRVMKPEDLVAEAGQTILIPSTDNSTS